MPSSGLALRPETMKPIKAIAVVSKKSPRLKVTEIYSMRDRREILLGKDERIAVVEIREAK